MATGRIGKMEVAFFDWLFVNRKSEGLATECKVAEGVADCLSIENGLVTEYEFKSEIHDYLLNEKKKTKKHKLYDEVKKLKSRIPNYYCFVIPESFLEDSRFDVDLFNPKYGIILYTPDFQFYYMRHPHRLHQRPNSALKAEVFRRMVRTNQRLVEMVLNSK